MKTSLLACFACVIAGLPLRAQDPPPSPTPEAASESERVIQSPLFQQLLHQVVGQVMKILTPEQRQSLLRAGGTSDGSGMLASLVAGLSDSPPDAPATGQASGFDAYSKFRLTNEPGDRHFNAATRTWEVRAWNDAERADLLTRFRQDYARLSASERARWETPGESAVDPTLAHAWDSSLSTGKLQAGGLRTGHLDTGHLQTGSLQTGHLDSTSTTNPVLPQRDFVTPTAAANLPPADPDEQMRRWSAQIDERYTSEQEARNAAIRSYPDLGVPNSTFNAQFLARYNQYRQADPFGFLRGPGWPMKLAIFTAGDLRRQQSGSAAVP